MAPQSQFVTLTVHLRVMMLYQLLSVPAAIGARQKTSSTFSVAGRLS